MAKNLRVDLAPIVDFLFEAGMLAHTPRSGFHFLGGYNQSVAEHMSRTAYIGYVLAQLENDPDVDPGKVMKMCLFHDLAEARTSDLNWMNQKYVEADEAAAVSEMTAKLPFGVDIKQTIDEYEARATKEAQLAKDADHLELLLVLKEMMDMGHGKAESWVPSLLKRLLTSSGRQLAKEILKTDSDAWWFGDKTDEWWVSRKKKHE